MFRNYNNKRHSKAKRAFLVVLIVLVVLGNVAVPKPARAQLDALSAAMQTVLNVFKIPYDILHWVYEKANIAYEKVGKMGFREALKNITNNIATDIATYIVTGDKGQAPMYQSSFADYIKKEADGFMGDALNNKLKDRWGVDLCEPLDPLFKVNLEIAAKEHFRKSVPQCSFSKMMKNIRDVRNLKVVDLPEFSDMFNPSSNDIGVFLEVTTQVQEQSKIKADLAKLEIEVNKGWKAVKSKVSGETLTPPDFIKKLSVDLPLDLSMGEKTVFTGELAADFIGPFTNTLISKFGKKIKEGLFKSQAGGGIGGTGGTYSPGLSGASPVQAAKERFADLGEPNYNFGGPFDLINNLSCENTESIYECTIDGQFRAALLEAPHLTVRQALQRGLLHGDWSIGYRADKSGATDTADKGIYSYRSLVILRKFRIIPVGWELAAEYYGKYDRTGRALTLNRLIGKDGRGGEVQNSDSPYYKLIDPNWVLKAPETLCEKQGAGELLAKQNNGEIRIPKDSNNDGKIDDLDEETVLPIRLPYCADERACIKENENGTGCLYYGYCTEEKPIWRIASNNGECPAAYNSCQAYTTRDGAQIGYLSNTLWGLDVCDASNAGCRQYCEEWNSQDNKWACTNEGDGDRIFLTSSVSGEECEPDQLGCSQFIRMSANVATPSNWIPNSSFEMAYQPDDAINPAYHQTDFTIDRGLSGGVIVEDAYDGNLAFEGDFNNWWIDIDPTNGDSISLAGRVFTLTVFYKGSNVNLSLNGESEQFNGQDGQWDRASLTVSVPLESTDDEILEIGVTGGGIIDAITLVEDETANYYREYGQNNINLKKAPEYLDCQDYTRIIGGDESSCSGLWRDDIEQCVAGGSDVCRDFALYCSAEDADCMMYEPASYQGPTIPGVVTSADYCPVECVGYDTYLETESFLDRNSRDVNLIPSTAKSCPASQNGCEEFTNLSEGAEGERKEYFSEIRSCVLPTNDKIATYYSWMSGDEEGNQLRSWTLLRTEMSNSNAPCTNSVTASDGDVSCTDSQDGAHICSVEATNPEDNPVYNPDCVEFISQEDNQSYWVKYSRIISTNEGCVPMRRTFDQSIYSIDPELSQSCSAVNAGCREYKGSQANNVEIVMLDDFEDGTSQGWTGGTNSNESLIANGHSLFVGGANTAADGWTKKEIGDLFNFDKSYKLSFWAKSNEANSHLLVAWLEDASDSNHFGSVEINSDWNHYELYLNETTLEGINGGDDLFLNFYQDSMSYNLDNIQLTETQDHLYLIRDSWSTPASCDDPTDGEMLGCEEYRSSGQSQYLRSFSRLCRDEVVGCETMIDTKNSSEPYSQTFDGGNTEAIDDETIAPDELVFMVYDKNKECQDVGCRRLGLIEPTRDSSMVFNDKYIVVNQDSFGEYNSPLCQVEELWCDKFMPREGGVSSYFKNPNVETCEYKQVRGNYGWYQTGSEDVCLSYEETAYEAHCIGGRSVINNQTTSGGQDIGENNLCNTAIECSDYAKASQGGACSSWVGVCPVEYDNCREYQDPSNPQDCNKASVYGEEFNSPDNNGPYCDFYYYMSDKVETCQTSELGEGCRAFNETSGQAGPKQWFSTPRCSGDSTMECEIDADCVDEDGTDWGSCEYTFYRRGFFDEPIPVDDEPVYDEPSLF